jgi:S1-C subfamily serine protease
VAIVTRNTNKDRNAGILAAPLTSVDDDDSYDVFALPSEIKSKSRKAFSPDYRRSVYKATVVGVDPGKDIAVLKIDVADPSILRPISVGTSTGKASQ